MKTLIAKAKISGFTLIEVLVVICVIAVLAAILLPALAPVKSRRTVSCMSNQKQIAIGFLMFKSDNGEKFPWQLSTTNGGAMEVRLDGHSSDQLRPSFQYVPNFSIYICPSDSNRITTSNITNFDDQSTSYFVNVDAAANNTDILTGDRHLNVKNKPINPGLFAYSNGETVSWATGFHHDAQNKPWGGLSFADGHVQFDNSDDLNSLLQKQTLATNHLAIP
jgi:prepilin-type N-terminal cleavage/methylation domain-containing protein